MAGARGETFVMQGSEGGPPVTFHSFILGIAASALIHLGQKPHPDTGAVQLDLPAARETLDLLGLLHEKTRGNLTSDEERLLTSLLADLRLKFVQATKS